MTPQFVTFVIWPDRPYRLSWHLGSLVTPVTKSVHSKRLRPVRADLRPFLSQMSLRARGCIKSLPPPPFTPVWRYTDTHPPKTRDKRDKRGLGLLGGLAR